MIPATMLKAIFNRTYTTNTPGWVRTRWNSSRIASRQPRPARTCRGATKSRRASEARPAPTINIKNDTNTAPRPRPAVRPEPGGPLTSTATAIAAAAPRRRSPTRVARARPKLHAKYDPARAACSRQGRSKSARPLATLSRYMNTPRLLTHSTRALNAITTVRTAAATAATMKAWVASHSTAFETSPPPRPTLPQPPRAGKLKAPRMPLWRPHWSRNATQPRISQRSKRKGKRCRRV